VTDGLGRASHFDEGFAIAPKLAAWIPPSLIGRQLSGDDAVDLLTTLMIGSRRSPVAEENVLAGLWPRELMVRLEWRSGNACRGDDCADSA
jgi:hypothetical protein